MGGFNLPKDFHDDPEALLQRARASITPPLRNVPPNHLNPPQTNPVYLEIPTELVLSEPPPTKLIHPNISASTSSSATFKATHDFSFPTISNVVIGPNILSGKEQFMLKP
jgi:hypothetical protein